MLDFAVHTLASEQVDRLRKFSADRSVDMHCHCLPGLDDGPEEVGKAIDLCRALVSDGITIVIATPHQLGAYEGMNPAADIRSAVTDLQQQVSAAGLNLQILPGADVRIDDQLIGLLDAGEIMTLADANRYLLLELPHDSWVEASSLLHSLKQRNITGIISHPERHTGTTRHLNELRAWLQAGALIQVTAGSLVGAFGPSAEKMAWSLIEGGFVSLIASDAHHSRRRPPMMTAAISAMTTRLGHALTRRLCIDYPSLILQGEAVPQPRVGAKVR